MNGQPQVAGEAALAAKPEETAHASKKGQRRTPAKAEDAARDDEDAENWRDQPPHEHTCQSESPGHGGRTREAAAPLDAAVATNCPPLSAPAGVCEVGVFVLDPNPFVEADTATKMAHS